MNTLKTALLLTLLTLMLVYLGRAIGGQQGMIFAFVFAAVMNFVAYFFSDKIALSMAGAQPVTEEQAPRLYQIVRRICDRTGLPMPKVYIIDNPSPNAFATGRNPNKAAVAATTGILQIMDDEELEGVMAHEMGHVRNRDILISTVAATLAGALMMLANMGRWALIFGGYGGRDRDDRGGLFGTLLLLIVAPIAALMVQMAISRSREYAADETGAKFVGHPYGLARALEKLEYYSKRIPMEASPATAHMYIVKPLVGSAILNLFSTHPPIEDRIRRLREMTARP